ncbi:MAG: RrF2 family transcriptional regulator [Lachnospiraceae bacterium]
MKISTKGRYAIRLMLDLALHNGEGPITIKDVAKRQEVSEKYLEQIISLLNKAGYVKSIRGAQGGYILRREPGEYTVGMILRTTEGSLEPVECVNSEGNECGRMEGCVSAMIWKRISEAVSGVVDSITLQDLVDWQNEKGNDYVI